MKFYGKHASIEVLWSEDPTVEIENEQLIDIIETFLNCLKNPVEINHPDDKVSPT